MISTYPSIVTPSLKLDENNWAVTLVREEWRFHALLVFEGVGEIEGDKETNYFFRIAHLTAANKENSCVENRCLFGTNKRGTVHLLGAKRKEKFQQRYSCKTATYVVARSKIEKLIQNIRQEASGMYPFIFFGDRSVLAKEAAYFKIYDPLLVKIQKKTQSYFCIYRQRNNFSVKIEIFSSKPLV